MSECYLVQYREAIRTGEIVAGIELTTELDNLIADLNNPRYIYDTTEAHRRIHFMENCIRLTKSPFYGKPMKLMLWQKAFIEVIYSFKMADKKYVDSFGDEKYVDRFQKIVLLIARKNTKSETCSALGLTESILGNQGADIVCSSNDDNQANILYDAIDTMRKMIDPKEHDTHKNQRFIKILATNSKIFKLSDRTRNKEGRNIDFAVVDEVHEMKNNVILKSIEQSQSLKDNPKLIIITTEGFVNEGALDEILRDCRRIINGEGISISGDCFASNCDITGYTKNPEDYHGCGIYSSGTVKVYLNGIRSVANTPPLYGCTNSMRLAGESEGFFTGIFSPVVYIPDTVATNQPIKKVTQTEYDNMESPSEAVIYVIVDDGDSSISSISNERFSELLDTIGTLSKI